MKQTVLQPPAPVAQTKPSALWALGFRPFYLLAAIFAALGMFTWIAQFSGWTGNLMLLRGPLWHAHEMIFGYAFAVIVGFLFTAGRNWTGQPTPTGGTLALIASLWLAARVLVLLPWTFAALAAAAADTAFALAAAAGLAIPLLKSKNRRNYFFVLLLVALGTGNLAFHLAMAGLLNFPVQRALQLGLDLVLFIMVVMGGRVIPMFSANGAPGSQPVRVAWLEHVSLATVLMLIAAELIGAPAAATGTLAGIAGLSNAARLALWQPWRTLEKPLVWILHASYAWIALSLLLRAMAAMDLLAANLATHAFTVGAVGGLTLGMMTRTARGHSGLRLEPGKMETTAFLLVQLAALARVFVPLAFPAQYLNAVIASGLLWSIAFALFVIKFYPILLTPRIDGREG